MAKENVLFLCTGNSVRSQMAEAFLRHYGDDQFEAYSAGLEAKGVNPYTIRAMDEVGIDIRNQTSDNVGEIGGQRYYRYIITVCAHADQNCPSGILALGREKLHWHFEDPAAATGTDADIMAIFRAVRDQIETKIKVWLGELKAETA
ncbi:MAG: arsenate reductase ArsC [Anaerolineae bacterium]|nr:arsenate reductase ArsC [Anaerolineae bacterium]